LPLSKCLIRLYQEKAGMPFSALTQIHGWLRNGCKKDEHGAVFTIA
jgi:hypothetical protein